jgi:hypothetical protein
VSDSAFFTISLVERAKVELPRFALSGLRRAEIPPFRTGQKTHRLYEK